MKGYLMDGETKDLPALVRATDGTSVAGYASLFGKADQGGDVVARGAFAASLRRMVAAGGRVRMLWQHDPREPIGIWDEVREDSRGLWVRGRLLTDVGRGREAAALLAAGAIDGLSIGYRAVKAGKDPKGRRLLQEVELWEVSLVTFPMLPEARAGAPAPDAKSVPDAATVARDLRHLSRVLAEARRRVAA